MNQLRSVALALVVGVILGASLSSARAAGEQANCSYTGGAMNLCQLATLAQGMLDLGYAPQTPVARIVIGDPSRPGPVFGQAVAWLKPEPARAVSRDVYRRQADGVPVLFVR